MADHKKENPLEETIEELFVDPDARKPAKTLGKLEALLSQPAA